VIDSENILGKQMFKFLPLGFSAKLRRFFRRNEPEQMFIQGALSALSVLVIINAAYIVALLRPWSIEIAFVVMFIYEVATVALAIFKCADDTIQYRRFLKESELRNQERRDQDGR
jgi:hypothetical protein